jgi:hypothetical protein
MCPSGLPIFPPPRCEAIDVRPNFCGLLFQILPHCCLPLIPSFKQTFFQHGFIPQVPRFWRGRHIPSGWGLPLILSFLFHAWELSITTFLSKSIMRSSSSLTIGIVTAMCYIKPYPCYTWILAIQRLIIQQKITSPLFLFIVPFGKNGVYVFWLP